MAMKPFLSEEQLMYHCRNERAKYIEAFWKAANWDFAGKCYAAVVK